MSPADLLRNQKETADQPEVLEECLDGILDPRGLLGAVERIVQPTAPAPKIARRAPGQTFNALSTAPAPV
jgi:hypothetical protein